MRTDVNVLTRTLTLQQWGRPRWFSRLRKLANLPNLYQNRMERAMGIEPTSETRVQTLTSLLYPPAS